MTNTKFSEKLIEAGQQVQQSAIEQSEFERKMMGEPPFIGAPFPASPYVQGIGWTIEQAGNGLRNLGFDEAEPEVTTSEVELIPTNDLQVVDNMNPTFSDLVPDRLRPSTYVIGAGEHLQENGWEGLGKGVETAGQTMRAFGFDEADEDELVGAKTSDIVKGVGVGITATGTVISTVSAASTPVTTIGGVAGTVVGGGVAAVGGVTAFAGFVVGWCGADVDESEADLLTGIKTNDDGGVCSYADKVTQSGNCSFDAVTGYALNNDDAAGFDWFQMHHDDGIMDGYLDTAENANGDMIFTESPEFLPGQTITFDESGMDGLVAAGPFDAVTLNEPQNNNVF